jgi:hypothetical protein
MLCPPGQQRFDVVTLDDLQIDRLDFPDDLDLDQQALWPCLG